VERGAAGKSSAVYGVKIDRSAFFSSAVRSSPPALRPRPVAEPRPVASNPLPNLDSEAVRPFATPSANTHAAGGVCSWAYAQNALRTIRDMASICLPRQQAVHFAHLGPHLGHVPRQQPTGHCYEYVRIACAEAVQPGPSLQRLCSARLARRGFHSNDELDQSPTTDR